MLQLGNVAGLHGVAVVGVVAVIIDGDGVFPQNVAKFEPAHFIPAAEADRAIDIEEALVEIGAD